MGSRPDPDSKMYLINFMDALEVEKGKIIHDNSEQIRLREGIRH